MSWISFLSQTRLFCPVDKGTSFCKISFLASSQNTMFWRDVSHPSASEMWRVFMNNPSCSVLSCTGEVAGWWSFHFVAVSNTLLGLRSTVCPQVSWGMGGFSLKLVEACRGLTLTKDSRMLVIRKFGEKRMSDWSTTPRCWFACGGCTADCVLNTSCWQQISVTVVIRRSGAIKVLVFDYFNSFKKRLLGRTM